MYNLEEEQEFQEKTLVALKDGYAEQEDKVVELNISNEKETLFN